MGNRHAGRAGRAILAAAGAAVLALGGCSSGEADYPVEATLYDADGISTAADEFAFSMEPEGGRLYFNRVGEGGHMAIWTALPDTDEAPVPVSFTDGRYNDIDPFVSRDGGYLFFSSNRPRPGSGSDEPRGDYDLWYALREGDGWGILVHAGDVLNTDASEVYYSEAEDGRFVLTRMMRSEGGNNVPATLTGRRQAGTFGDLGSIDPEPRSLRLSNPALSPDGGTLVMAGGLPGDAPDLWIARRTGEGWAPFEPLAGLGVNTEAAEFAPYICNKGEWMWFTSDRARGDGGAPNRDLYTVRLQSVIAH